MQVIAANHRFNRQNHRFHRKLDELGQIYI